jgi:hypothetical protein
MEARQLTGREPQDGSGHLRLLQWADSLFCKTECLTVSLFNPASISIRAGRSAAFVLPIVAAAAFSADSRAQTADIFFYPAPLSASHDSFAAPAPPPSVEKYTLNARPGLLSAAPKVDFQSSEQWNEYLSRYRDDTEDSFGRVPLNGGSFGLDAERKLDLKKVGPSSEYVESNIEKNAKKPFVGFSIVTPYSSE